MESMQRPKATAKMSSAEDIREPYDNTYWNPPTRERTRKRQNEPKSLSPTALESLPKHLQFASRAPKKRKPKSPPRAIANRDSKTPPRRTSPTQIINESKIPWKSHSLSTDENKPTLTLKKQEKTIVKLMKSTLPKFSNQIDEESGRTRARWISLST
jgi:hypothetical protein